METFYCGKCEGANDTLTEVACDYGLCEYCYEDYIRDIEVAVFNRQRGDLFTWGSGAFIGHSSLEKWNGFEVPQFSRDEVLNILQFMREQFDSVRHVIEVGTSITYEDLNTGENYTLTPNEHGRYVFDGWAWEKLDIVGDEFANLAFNAIEERLSATGNAIVFDSFRDELLNTFALEIQFIGEENAKTNWRNLHKFLTDY
jgi:hypothetical protein